MTDLTFVYFKMRALGEAPQMMLHYRNQPYRYMMGWEYFGKPWPDAKRGAAFRQLPMLVTEDGAQIWNQEGSFILGNLWEYADEKAFIACQELFREAEAAHSESTGVSSIIVPSRGVILHDTRL